MTINTETTRRTRRTAIACAAALAGATLIVGAGASPSAARPDFGVIGGQGSTVAAGELSRVTLTLSQRSTVGPTRVAGLMGVHVEGGWLLR